MNGIHILNKVVEGSNYKRLGLSVIKGSTPLKYRSGAWDPISMGFKDVDEAKDKLVGGMVYLHNEKTTASFVGGLILDIYEVLLEEDGKREDRFEITFQSMIEGKGQKWRGRKGPYVYNSGLIKVE